jgi:PKD repeat protein
VTFSSFLRVRQHDFVTTGPFDVKLKVTSSKGCIDSLTRKLTTVLEQPKAAFSSEDSICLGDLMQFADSSKTKDGILNKWFWDFVGETRDTLANTSYFYKQPGKKTIIFFAKNDLARKIFILLNLA